MFKHFRAFEGKSLITIHLTTLVLICFIFVFTFLCSFKLQYRFSKLGYFKFYSKPFCGPRATAGHRKYSGKLKNF